MRLRRVSVIAVISLLTSAATANAECAWVLWVVYGDGSGGIKLVRQALQGCIEELSREAADQTKTLTFGGYKAPVLQESDETHKVMIFVRDQQESKPLMVRLQCLPDTVPRPPKP